MILRRVAGPLPAGLGRPAPGGAAGFGHPVRSARAHPGRTAGPAFDIAPAIFLLAHQDAAWRIIKERLDALERARASLGKQPGLGALAPLASKLHSMGQDVGTHIPRTSARP